LSIDAQKCALKQEAQMRTLLAAVAVCAITAGPAAAFDNWVPDDAERAAMNRMTKVEREAYVHFMSLPDSKLAVGMFLLGMTPDLPCHWNVNDNPVPPPCLKERVDRFASLKATMGADDVEVAAQVAAMERAESNAATWKAPPGSIDLCPKPHRMTRDGCQ
jgi:hypothetical protein